MPKRSRRREQQHLRQAPNRRRRYGFGGTQPEVKYRPEFPFNLLQNTRAFYIIGAVIMVGGVLVAAIAGSTGGGGRQVDITPTATTAATGTVEGTQTPGASPTPQKQFAAAEQVIDAAKNKYVATIKTDKGDIEIDLLADVAPNTVNSFVFLARNSFFDGLTFHRVMANFVVQGGDPRGDGTGGPGYTTKEEVNELKNLRGFVAMAKSQGATAFGSQFFVNLKDNPALDAQGNRFYPFGQVIRGMEVVDRIERGDVIRSVTITETPK